MVNTLDPVAGELARRYGARIVTKERATGTPPRLQQWRASSAGRSGGHARAARRHPRVTSTEIAAVIDARRPSPSVTIVPAHDERGSNAVLCSPPTVMQLRFGDDSFLPHLTAARALGIEPTIVKLPGIGLDIDQPRDLEALRRAAPHMATRTAAILEW